MPKDGFARGGDLLRADLGDRRAVATSEQAQEAIAFVRALVADRDKEAGEAVRILYGGSLKPDNAPELLSLPDVDGALVGGGARARRSRRSSRPPEGERRPHHPRRMGPGPGRAGNAISLADTPCSTGCGRSIPTRSSAAKGEAVGLPEGQMGNSEVGHLNLGAGAIVPQDLARIDAPSRTARWPERDPAGGHADAPRVHLLGLVSEGRALRSTTSRRS